MHDDPDPKRLPPRSAAELLERYAAGERDFEDSLLAGAQLAGKDLSGANFRRSRFAGATLRGANLREADLSNTFCEEADMRGADLEFSNLNIAVVRGADLSEARVRWVNCAGLMAERAVMRRLNLIHSDLKGARLQDADLREACFIQAVLDQTNLMGAGLADAMFGETVLGACSLSGDQGLELAVHRAPSVVSTAFLAPNQGRIPDAFLKGCGLADWEIVASRLYDPDLTPDEIAELQYRIFDLRTARPIIIGGVFISYADEDGGGLADALYQKLQASGIRCWLDKHDMMAGRITDCVEPAEIGVVRRSG